MIECWAQVLGIIKLPAVVMTRGEVMAIDVQNQEFHIVAGDDETIRFTVQDDKPTEGGGPDKYPLTVDDRFKFSVKVETTLLAEVLFKTSYRAGDLDLSGIAVSHVAVLVRPNDLRGALQGTYRWQLEMFREGAFALGTGTIDVAAGGTVVTGTGTAFTSELESGDIVEVAGDYTVVREIYDDESMSVDPGDWGPVVGQPFQFADRPFNKTIAGGFLVIGNELTV